MTDRTKRGSFGRSLLLGTVLATLPLAACDIVNYSPKQQAMYSQVVTTKDPVLASDFLRKYPDSPLVRNLLVSLPPAALRRLSKDAVDGISPSILGTLPADILVILGRSGHKPPPPIRHHSTGYSG